MDTDNLKKHLKTLIELNGASGFEDAIQDYLRGEWAELVDELDTDGIGSLIGIKRGTGTTPRKRIMLCAHMDEIGSIVSKIKDGYLQLASISGLDPRLMVAKPVLVHTRTTVLHGVVASVSPYISRANNSKAQYAPFAEQWIDLGLPAKKVEELVRVGDMVTMDALALDLGDKIAGKAMDDRASVAAVTACLHDLQNRQHIWDVYAVASVQEETGLKGATTAAYKVKPDAAIALDVEFAQQPDVNEDEYPTLGQGPTIGIGPNFHDGLNESIQDAAKRLEMKLFVTPMPGRSGTDAWAIQVSHAGIPTALLSIPIRNMHSPIETLSLKDVERTGRLLAEFIGGMAEDYLDTIQWKPNDNDTEKSDKDDW